MALANVVLVPSCLRILARILPRHRFAFFSKAAMILRGGINESANSICAELPRVSL
jgi:hypothetical protein